MFHDSYVSDVMDARGVSDPVVLAAILAVTAVAMSVKNEKEKPAKGQLSPVSTALVSAGGVGILWGLSYYGKTEAAWVVLAVMAYLNYDQIKSLVGEVQQDLSDELGAEGSQ